MDEWQPIDTAPKRGRLLLAAWCPAFSKYQVCYGHWYSVRERWEYDGYSWGNPETQPDYWMPLPSPPNSNPPERHTL